MKATFTTNFSIGWPRLPVVMPPLRERTEDIPALVKHYAAKATNPLFDANLVEFTDDAMAVLKAYHWPGNLTEFFQLSSRA
jgi:two-component system response regulator HydG